jgi:alpha-D-ribose 1-methylphosphonate 5-triphosphate synthase subunit PhnG
MHDVMPSDQPHAERRHWMAVLARADSATITELIGTSDGIPEYRRLRGPDSGLVMVRGRAGGGGAAFNLGEMTVTRCTVRTDAGFVGHAYVAGRDERQAELAALADALLQDPTHRPRLLATLIEPLAAAQRAGRDATAAKAAATRVQFFAMRNMRA